MKKVNKIILIIAMIFSIVGCKKETVESQLLNHNIDDVCNLLKENKDIKENNEVKKEILTSYYKLLNDIYSKKMKVREIKSYKKDIYHLKNNIEVLVEIDNDLSEDFDKLYNDFDSLSKYRGKFNKVKEYYSNEDFTKMNEILSRISLRDKYAMKKVLNLTNDKTSIVTLENYKFKSNGGYAKERNLATDVEYTIKNHTNDALSSVTVLMLYYRKNGDVVSLEHTYYDDYKFIENDRIYPIDDIKSGDVYTTMNPYNGSKKVKISIVPIEYTKNNILTVYKNEKVYLQVFKEIIKNNIKVPNVKEYHYMTNKIKK